MEDVVALCQGERGNCPAVTVFWYLQERLLPQAHYQPTSVPSLLNWHNQEVTGTVNFSLGAD